MIPKKTLLLQRGLFLGSMLHFCWLVLYKVEFHVFFSNLRLMAQISFKKGSAWKVILSREFQTENGIKVSKYGGNPSENSVLDWKWYWYLNVLDGLDVPPTHNNCHPCHPFLFFLGASSSKLKMPFISRMGNISKLRTLKPLSFL